MNVCSPPAKSMTYYYHYLISNIFHFEVNYYAKIEYIVFDNEPKKVYINANLWNLFYKER